MKARIAMFKSSRYDWTNVFEEDKEIDGYYRVTAWEEVEFTELNKDDQVGFALEELDGEKAVVTTRFQQALDDIANRKAKFLSLTHQA